MKRRAYDPPFHHDVVDTYAGIAKGDNVKVKELRGEYVEKYLTQKAEATSKAGA